MKDDELLNQFTYNFSNDYYDTFLLTTKICYNKFNKDVSYSQEITFNNATICLNGVGFSPEDLRKCADMLENAIKEAKQKIEDNHKNKKRHFKLSGIGNSLVRQFATREEAESYRKKIGINFEIEEILEEDE